MAQRMNIKIIYIIKKQKCRYKSNFYNKYLLLKNLLVLFWCQRQANAARSTIY